MERSRICLGAGIFNCNPHCHFCAGRKTARQKIGHLSLASAFGNFNFDYCNDSDGVSKDDKNYKITDSTRITYRFTQILITFVLICIKSV